MKRRVRAEGWSCRGGEERIAREEEKEQLSVYSYFTGHVLLLQGERDHLQTQSDTEAITHGAS